MSERPEMKTSDRYVVVFGVDGVRLDTLRAARTPHLDAIEAAGFLAEFEVSTDAPTLSGPCWASVATGMPPRVHGIFGNVFANHRLGVFGDVFATVRRRGLPTFVGAAWAPLVTTAHGGPVFAPPTRLSYADGEVLGHDAADGLVADDAARALGQGDFNASFVYLGEPDEVAHAVGCGSDYVAAIERADARVGRVRAAIEARPTYPAEHWTFLVVTDHGHVDAGGHGGRSRWERTAWLAACGAGVGGAAPDGVNHLSVAPTVLAALGHDLRHESHLPGVSLVGDPVPAT
ncbi:alkaline phosphatase family protein [Catellatospora tritici]|uniref:alkaline phosphatase family protein n=1 Tax=Catellatospora tritici TaxID=2851566 RepID=UPI001C2D1FB5|nr:alkaline phosphatase family protein [Catellatospora tritici]MBV1851649.1 alkaline phosphatase family protein [Catellatospora tritici]